MGISHLIGVTVAISLSAGAAVAQDNWAGFYGGISIDAVRSTSQVGASSVHSFKEKSAGVGLFAGYNIVRDNGFVWGPEIALTGVSTGGTRTGDGLGSSSYDGSFLLNPRLRGGYATDKIFVYGILGLSMTDAMARPSGTRGTDIIAAPSFGLGVEFALGDEWSSKIEAVHHRFDSDRFDFNGTQTHSDNAMTQITLGLSRKF